MVFFSPYCVLYYFSHHLTCLKLATHILFKGLIQSTNLYLFADAALGTATDATIGTYTFLNIFFMARVRSCIYATATLT